MKVRFFVSVSALLISLWLLGTYVRVVPMETYSGKASPAPGNALVEASSGLEAPEGVVVDR